MFEAMDIAIGRLLEDLNLATLNPERTRITSLHLDNTLLVIAGDNGTFGTAVKAPFSPERSKGTVYQSGVAANRLPEPNRYASLPLSSAFRVRGVGTPETLSSFCF